MTYVGYMNMDTSSHYMDDLSQRLSFTPYPDKNNNTPITKMSPTARGDKYSLRPRSLRKGEDPDEDSGIEVLKKRARGGTTSKQKQKPAPLSKYRRKTANARERSRMREINAAFEALRRCVPAVAAAPAPAPSSEKLTKITTLRLAMKYISTLSAALRDAGPTAEAPAVQHAAMAHHDLADLLSDCSDLDCLLLESDGESLPLSDHSLTSDMPEQCLTPVNLNMNFDHFAEHSLSPTFTDQELSPFDSLFPDFS